MDTDRSSPGELRSPVTILLDQLSPHLQTARTLLKLVTLPYDEGEVCKTDLATVLYAVGDYLDTMDKIMDDYDAGNAPGARRTPHHGRCAGTAEEGA